MERRTTLVASIATAGGPGRGDRANKPIPPSPANCQQPQLEDSGVWNCQ